MQLKRKSVLKFDNLITQKDFEHHDPQEGHWRFIFLYVITIIIFIFLFYNLFQLQIIDGQKNLVLASKISQSTTRVVPPRGLIYDVNSQKLVVNRPAYILYLKTNQVKSEDEANDIKKLAQLINVNEDELLSTYQAKVYKDGKRIDNKRVTLSSDLSSEQYLSLIANIDSLPGFYLKIEPIREYLDDSYFSHIIGYIGDPTGDDIKRGIYSESQVGKTGLEGYYDTYLRGTDGIEVVEKGVFDKRERNYTPQEPRYGDNLYLTLDATWQKKLTDIMQKQLDTVHAFASAGVIMNSRTGEIKAMVSLPSYSNNEFARGISGKSFSKLINDPHTPLLNRPIGLQLPPGSTYKIIGATAGLEEHVITTNTKFFSNRCMLLPGGKQKFCEADAGYLGDVDLKDALAKSSNIYFCNVALQINSQKNGIRTLMDYAGRYGIGQKTGVDLPGEQDGSLASPELKKKLLNEPWYTGDECNTIVGQGLVTVTPLQMVVTTSAVNNGGNIVQPHLLAKVVDQSGHTVFTAENKVIRNINVSQSTLDSVKRGMRQAALNGTATGLGTLPGNVIAKTGSADAGEYIQGKYYVGAHSWVIGCFDYQGENYCFTVMQQWGGRGYKTVPIMKKFISCLYNGFTNSCEDK